MIRTASKLRSAGPKIGSGISVDLPDVDKIPIEVDARRIIRQVPVTWHPHYGVNVGLSMGTLLLAVGILGFMAFATQSPLLFWAASLAVSIFFISIVYPGWIVHSIRVTKSVPDTGTVAQPLPITYTAYNTRRYFSLHSIRLVEIFDQGHAAELPRVYIPRLGKGKNCTFQVLVTPIRRGQMICLGTRIASKYPFGLLTRFRTQIDRRSITIYPALGTLAKAMIPANRRSDFHLGLTQPRYRGTSDEFYALREYRPGDNPRLIHWKRSARMKQLIVREMSQYAPNRITVILDTFLPDRNFQKARLFEHAVSFAATILCHSLESGYRSGLVCASLPPVMVPPLAGREAQHRILRTLSAVEPQVEHPLSELFHHWRFTGGWTGRCFIVSLSEPPSNVLAKLTELIGPIEVYVAGAVEWRNAFIPPACLRTEG